MTNARLRAQGDRNLILIDIENLAGTPSPAKDEVETVITNLRVALPSFDNDQRIVACSHHAAAVVAFAFPTARKIWRSGRNGADMALLSVLENERVAERYRRVTICSGDGIFTNAAARLARAGVDVTVVSAAEQLATRLQLAARNVTFVPAAASIIALPSGA